MKERMTLSQWRKEFVASLAGLYPPQEAQALFFRSVEHALGIGRLRYAMEKDRELSGEDSGRLRSIEDELLTGRPLQYIVGEQMFCGRRFSVDARVLIPRGETEELVDRVLRENAMRTARVLDVGTGSGAIAVSLALARPAWKVEALDVSPDALALARENARRLGAEVEFRQADILQEDAWTALGTYDMVVSNPPYVRESERAQMHDNVRRYEPPLALFVPDEDPLRFYRAIGRFALAGLAAGGRLYFEINRAFGRKTAELLTGLGFAEVEVFQDINGCDRMVRAVKK